MSQAEVTVNDIINRAYAIAGQGGQDEVLPSFATNEGVKTLNLILAGYSGNNNYISFKQTLEFTTTPNKSTYKISNVAGLPDIDINFNRLATGGLGDAWTVFQDIQYPIDELSDREFFRVFQYEPFSFRPSRIHIDYQPTYTKIRLYPIPDGEYDIFLRGDYYLDDFRLNSPIRNIPIALQEFLAYELARRLLLRGETWSANQEQIYQDLKGQALSTKNIDFTVKTSSLLQYPFRWNGYSYWGNF